MFSSNGALLDVFAQQVSLFKVPLRLWSIQESDATVYLLRPYQVLRGVGISAEEEFSVVPKSQNLSN
jgi:hypothetical protein